MKRLFMKRNSRDSGMGTSPRVSLVPEPTLEPVVDVKEAQEVSAVVVDQKRQVKTSGTFKIKALVTNVMEELQCPICLEEFVKPRLLQCGHSFCTGCLKSIYANDVVKCPACRTVTRFDDRPFQVQPRAMTSFDMRQSCVVSSSQNQVVGAIKPERHPVETLSLNYSILRVIDIIDGMQNHKKAEDATAFYEAFPTPQQVKLNGSIKLDTPQQVPRAGQWQDHMLLCKTHKFEEVQFWCSTCEVLLCSQCLVSQRGKSGHASHDLETLQTAAQSQLKKIQDCQVQTEAKMQLLNNINAQLDSQLRFIDDNRTKLNVELNTIKDAWIAHVTNWYEAQVDNLSKLKEVETVAVDSRKQWVDVCSHYLQKGHQSVENVLKECDRDSGILKKRDIVKIWNEAFEVKERTMLWKQEVEESCEKTYPQISFKLETHLSSLPEGLELATLPPLQSVVKSIDDA